MSRWKLTRFPPEMGLPEAAAELQSVLLRKMKNLQGASKSSRHMNASNPKDNPENKGDSLLLHGNLRTHLIKECRLLKPTVATNTELFDFHKNLWIQTLDPKLDVLQTLSSIL